MSSIRRRSEIEVPNTISGFCSREFARLRLAKNAAMHEVAEDAGLSLGFVCDFENGRRGISIENFCELIFALGEPPSEVLESALKKWAKVNGHRGIR